MTISNNTPFLRQALLLDAAVSGATGVLMAALASTLAGFLELPPALLFWAGLFFFPFCAALVFLATREELPHWTVWAVIVANVVWAIDCTMLAFGSSLEPNAYGKAFLLLQALAVLVFAELEYMALRRAACGATERSYA